MVEINPVPIICQAREAKRPLTFSFYEIEYVAQSLVLNPLEKLLWWLLAAETNRDPQLACLLSYLQIAYTLQIDHLTVHHALHRLVRMGFIQVSGLPLREQTDFTQEELLMMRLFMLSLPFEALLMLKKTPRYRPNIAHQQGVFRSPPMLINLLTRKDRDPEI